MSASPAAFAKSITAAYRPSWCFWTEELLQQITLIFPHSAMTVRREAGIDDTACEEGENFARQELPGVGTKTRIIQWP